MKNILKEGKIEIRSLFQKGGILSVATLGLFILLFSQIEIIEETSDRLALKKMSLKDKLGLKYAYQFSSLAVLGDTLFLTAEKCQTVYMVHKTSLHLIGTFPLPNTASVEGVSLIRGRYLMMLDEDRISVFLYDLYLRKKIEIGNSRILGTSNSGKLEGIAFDEDSNVCFVLHETGMSIATFRLVKDSALIPDSGYAMIPTCKGWDRATDLLFHNGALYVLKTKARTKYRIDKIPVWSGGVLNMEGTREFANLDNCTKFGSHLSTNLEGMTVVDDNMYVISDNEESSSTTCKSGTELRTLLFSFPMPK
jgi:hypothetical protein